MTAAEQAAEVTTQEAVHTRALIIGTGFSGSVWPSICSSGAWTS